MAVELLEKKLNDDSLLFFMEIEHNEQAEAVRKSDDMPDVPERYLELRRPSGNIYQTTLKASRYLAGEHYWQLCEAIKNKADFMDARDFLSGIQSHEDAEGIDGFIALMNVDRVEW